MAEMDSLVTIGRVHGAGPMAYIMGFLDAHDVPVFAHGFHTDQVMANYSLAMGGAVLRVPAAQANDAAALLNDLPPFEQSLMRPWVCILCILGWIGFGVPPAMTAIFTGRNDEVQAFD
ncbi:hypothetical protein [Parasulfitobacter algicola]|uniref:DUF2007 domain-containing protein n=1 Tax=Parasulfitobacter algicola TaxID=2614809 RepID=A0ABX2IUT6_9RHOB|nr:hypothetical protein [Sulfitobacter algicola]NSX54144.1 hypothetical protein [Sulfitobacter algicola]